MFLGWPVEQCTNERHVIGICSLLNVLFPVYPDFELDEAANSNSCRQAESH